MSPPRIAMSAASSQRQGEAPSRGRRRKAVARASIPAHGRPSRPFDRPPAPMAPAGSLAARVKTAWAQASRITATRLRPLSRTVGVRGRGLGGASGFEAARDVAGPRAVRISQARSVRRGYPGRAPDGSCVRSRAGRCARPSPRRSGPRLRVPDARGGERQHVAAKIAVGGLFRPRRQGRRVAGHPRLRLGAQVSHPEPLPKSGDGQPRRRLPRTAPRRGLCARPAPVPQGGTRPRHAARGGAG